MASARHSFITVILIIFYSSLFFISSYSIGKERMSSYNQINKGYKKETSLVPFATQMYRVREGDSLEKISRRYNVNVDILRKINKLYKLQETTALKEGTFLLVPSKPLDPAVSGYARSVYNLNKPQNFAEKLFYWFHENRDIDLLAQQAKARFGRAVQDKIDSWLNQYGTIAMDVDGRLDVLLPLQSRVDHIHFLQFGSRFFSEQSVVNVGFGYRRFFDESMYGLNSFIDYRPFGDHWRFGIGGEFNIKLLDFSLNIYAPLSDWRNPGSGDSNYLARPALGWDMWVKARMPFFEQLSIDFNYESYLRKVFWEDVGSFIDNPQMLSLNLRYQPIPLLNAGIGYKIDKSGHKLGVLDLRATYRLGVPFPEQIKFENVKFAYQLHRGRYDLVKRNHNIILEYKTKVEESNPATVKMTPKVYAAPDHSEELFEEVVLDDNWVIEDWKNSSVLEEKGLASLAPSCHDIKDLKNCKIHFKNFSFKKEMLKNYDLQVQLRNIKTDQIIEKRTTLSVDPLSGISREKSFFTGPRYDKLKKEGTITYHIRNSEGKPFFFKGLVLFEMQNMQEPGPPAKTRFLGRKYFYKTNNKGELEDIGYVIHYAAAPVLDEEIRLNALYKLEPTDKGTYLGRTYLGVYGHLLGDASELKTTPACCKFSMGDVVELSFVAKTPLDYPILNAKDKLSFSITSLTLDHAYELVPMPDGSAIQAIGNVYKMRIKLLDYEKVRVTVSYEDSNFKEVFSKSLNLEVYPPHYADFRSLGTYRHENGLERYACIDMAKGKRAQPIYLRYIPRNMAGATVDISDYHDKVFSVISSSPDDIAPMPAQGPDENGHYHAVFYPATEGLYIFDFECHKGGQYYGNHIFMPEGVPPKPPQTEEDMGVFVVPCNTEPDPFNTRISVSKDLISERNNYIEIAIEPRDSLNEFLDVNAYVWNFHLYDEKIGKPYTSFEVEKIPSRERETVRFRLKVNKEGYYKVDITYKPYTSIPSKLPVVYEEKVLSSFHVTVILTPKIVVRDSLPQEYGLGHMYSFYDKEQDKFIVTPKEFYVYVELYDNDYNPVIYDPEKLGGIKTTLRLSVHAKDGYISYYDFTKRFFEHIGENKYRLKIPGDLPIFQRPSPYFIGATLEFNISMDDFSVEKTHYCKILSDGYGRVVEMDITPTYQELFYDYMSDSMATKFYVSFFKRDGVFITEPDYIEKNIKFQISRKDGTLLEDKQFLSQCSMDFHKPGDGGKYCMEFRLGMYELMSLDEYTIIPYQKNLDGPGNADKEAKIVVKGSM